jgi:hypothetical protein
MRNVTKISLALLMALVLVPQAFVSARNADTTFIGWKKSMIIDLTTTQTAYSDSWLGGEAGSVNWVGNLNAFAEKKLSPDVDFRSTLRLSFGQTLTQDAETKDWSKPKKSTDLIDWDNVARFTLGKYVDPFVGFRLEGRFLNAQVPNKKLYLTPLKFTESAGIARRFYERDKDQVTSRLGLAVKQTLKKMILSYDPMYTTGDSTLIDGGLESVTDANLTLNERLSYTGKLSLYKAFFFSGKDDVLGTPYEDYWKAIDVNWENMVSASISKIVTVNLYTQFLYDKQESRKGRIKETVGLGLVYKMW